ncbi:MAG: type II secretion system F family protein [Acetobacteraceae bacterium]|nr:type II secretion system F family protein [Acetobacteraceae bacterium]
MMDYLADQSLMLRAVAMVLPLLLAAGLALLLRRAERLDVTTRRLQGVMLGRRANQSAANAFPARLLLGIAGFGRAIAGSGVLSGKALDGIRKQLAGAGVRGSNAVGLFLGTKIILAVTFPVLLAATVDVHVSGLMHKMLIVAAAVFGLLLPEFILKSMRKRYLAALESGVPDMLDMLVMCTESGLSLEPALTRVCSEIASIHPVMARELALTTGELHIMTEPRAAFTNLGERSGLRGLTRLASTLTQTLQYGTPLAPALRSLTTEMRQDMLTRFEERAGRLPSLLTVVMILFILPSLFMIVGGPAVLQVMQQLRN